MEKIFELLQNPTVQAALGIICAAIIDAVIGHLPGRYQGLVKRLIKLFRGQAKTTLVLALVIPLLVGCGAMQTAQIDLSETGVQNAEAGCETARNILKAWPYHSGVIKGAIYQEEERFSILEQRLIGRLDEVAAKFHADPESVSQEELGWVVGAQGPLASSIVKEAIRQVAPDLRRLLGL